MAQPYYGPVGQDGEGILTDIVQIPTDGAGETSQNRWSFSEKFKGPWSLIKEMPFRSSGGLGPFMFGIKRSVAMAGAGSVVHRYEAPAAPNGRTWFLQGCTTTELEAGGHGEITVTWMAQDPDWKADDGSMSSDDLDKHDITWDCSWMAYSENVLAYCDEGEVFQHSSSSNDKCYAGNIRGWAQANAADQKDWQFREGGDTFQLNEKEQQIAKFYSCNRNPTFHAPLITKTDRWKTRDPSDSMTAGENIDHIENPSGCDIKFDENWKFLKVGDAVSYTVDQVYLTDLSSTETVYTVNKRSQWQGAMNFESHFYGEGSDRWKIGGGDFG